MRSVFKKLWSYLTIAPEDKPSTVGIFITYPSDAMNHYVERLVACLRMVHAGVLQVVIYEQVHHRTRDEALLEQIGHDQPDLFVAMDSDASNVLVRLAREGFISKPGFLLGYEELVKTAIPPTLTALFSLADWRYSCDVLRQVYPKLKKLLVCAGNGLLDRYKPLRDFRLHAAQHGIEVVGIYAEGADSLSQQFALSAPDADMVLLVFDQTILPHTNEILRLSHEHDLLVVSRYLYGIHQGADISLGYPEAKIMDFLAHSIMKKLQGEMVPAKSTFSFPLELHCNVKNLRKRPYVLENVGRLFLEADDLSVHIHADDKARR